MSLPRCPRCRSAVNPAWFARCIGCGWEVDRSLPPPKTRLPVVREAKRDSEWSFAFFLVIGVLGVIGLSASFRSGFILILSAAAGLVGVAAMIARVMQVSPGSTGPSCLQLAGTIALSDIALIFGLLPIMSIACMHID